MTPSAKVKLWSTTVGTVVLEDGNPIARFQYDPEFIESGIEVSPLMIISKNAR